MSPTTNSGAMKGSLTGVSINHLHLLGDLLNHETVDVATGSFHEPPGTQLCPEAFAKLLSFLSSWNHYHIGK